MVPIFKNGELVYKLPSLKEIGKYADENIAMFFPEYRRVVNTQTFKVDLSQKLWNLKQQLLNTSVK